MFHVPLARCLSGLVSLSARTQRPPCSFAAHVLRLGFTLLKSSLSLLPRASLLLGWLGSAPSSLHQLQSQVQWSIQRITALDWCGESDL